MSDFSDFLKRHRLLSQQEANDLVKRLCHDKNLDPKRVVDLATKIDCYSRWFWDPAIFDFKVKLPAAQPLRKQSLLELAWLLETKEPEEIEPALEAILSGNKKNKNEFRQSLLPTIKHNYPEGAWHEAIRIKRTELLYQRWEKVI